MEVSQDEAERLRFWSGRKNAFPASGRISPDYMCMDSTIPRKRLADILLAIQEMEKKYQLRCCNVFHAGDGNLHPLILFDANDPDQLHRCELFGAEILETSVAMGGTVTGEHGVGVEKLNSMCVQFSPEERAQMFAVKAAFDPAGLLNPGKVPHAAPLRRIRPHACEAGLLPFPNWSASDRGRSRDPRPPLAALVEQVREAAERRQPLCIRGSGSKDFYGGPLIGEPLSLGELRGISSYEPTELVVTARAGTPLAELEAALAEKGQWLPFEPPRFEHTPGAARAAAPWAAWWRPAWPARPAPRWAACATTCWAPRCSTARPSC
jgi:FAD/FMN-containing dehydrogenase